MSQHGALSQARNIDMVEHYRQAAEQEKPKSRHCLVDLVTGSGPCPVKEVACLLRYRLRLAVLILLAAFGFFLVSNIIQAQSIALETSELVIHIALVAIMVPLAILLWSRWPLTLGSLRLIDFLMPALAAVFFGWGQYEIFRAGGKLDSITDGNPASGMRMAVMASSLRWFTLIVIYGTFIPNNWRRCAVASAVISLVPIAITAGVTLHDGTFSAHIGALSDMAMLMLVASAIAVFGSHKIHEYRTEAFEARQLGQYRLKERLGSGGMGEVYLAEHLLLRRPCAVKLIRPEQAGDPANLSRFEREVQATATLTHWNTVEIFDYGRTAGGTFYYVMEFLPGLSLEALVEKHGPLTPGRAVHFLRQICAGLREAHGIGLIHRDIKPSNVIACERGGVHDVAKVLDFGLVHDLGLGRADDKLTREGMVVGSPPFMSPEQAAGKSGVDQRTDIYSVGSVAYFLLTGQPPFVRETTMQTLLAHAYEPVIPPSQLQSDVPADLQAVVLRCLEKDPKRRFEDAASLDKALASCACAGDWTEEAAASWWQALSSSSIPATAELETPNNQVTTSLPHILSPVAAQ
jgi:serine/threonine-protein kinase